MLIKGHKNIMLVRGHTSLDDYPEGADAHPGRADERRARVEADPVHHRGILGEARIEPGVLHHEHVRAEDRVGAEGDLAWGLVDRDPDTRLEPLAVAIDQRDHRDRDAEQLGRQGRQAVEGRFRRRVQHAESLERGEAPIFIQDLHPTFLLATAD